MKIIRFFQAVSMTAVLVFVMAATARASTVTYTTNSPGTKFVGGTLVLNSTSGQSATITFVPNISSTSGLPSFIDLGDFQFACATCTLANGLGATFGAFQFDLTIVDTTDGNATGTFVGSSTGGTITYNSSPVSINWVPLILGPGTTNASSGNFGATWFTTTTVTNLAALNSGTPPGDTTVQGGVNSNAIPEPATLSLIGGGLLGLGMLWRKRLFRQ